MDRAMHFADFVVAKTCLLELAVHVAGEDEGAFRHLVGQLDQEAEAVVRQSVAIEIQSMAVEAPGEPRVGLEGKLPHAMA
jgi:hypothetical protein